MLHGIAFTSLLCGMKVTANNYLPNCIWSDMQNVLLLSGAAHRASVEEWRKLHAHLVYSSIPKKKMPLESMLSSNNHRLKSQTLGHLCESFLVTGYWPLGMLSTEETSAAILLSLTTRALDQGGFVLWDNQLLSVTSLWSFPGPRSHMAQRICCITFPFLTFIQQNAISLQVA